MTRQEPKLSRSQRGAATLLVAVVLLVAVTLIVIVTARTAVMEQRISANEVRSKSAFEAAQAGLDFGLSYMHAPGGIDKDGNDVVDQVTPTAVTLTTAGGRLVGSYQVAFCDRTAPGTLDCANIYGCTAPVNRRQAMVLACGWSDDGVAVQSMVQAVLHTPAMANPATNPVTTRGAVNVQGSATVTNYFNNLTIWTGQAVNNIGASGKTFIRNPSIPVPPSDAPLPAVPNACQNTATYSCTTDNNRVGPDVIAQDTSISSLTQEQFFINFFGRTPAEYRATVPTLELLPAQVGTLGGLTAEVIWIEGDATMHINTPIGTRDEPVIVIVNGDLSGAGGTTINGVLYVLGDMSVSGNFGVNGSVVVDGTVSGTGSLDVMFDPIAAGNAGGDIGVSGSLAGTWRDWL